MGKRFSESMDKKMAGQARKREQARDKLRQEEAKLESMEAEKWEQGSKKASKKQLEEEEKKKEKLRLKLERENQMKEEEEALGKGGKGPGSTKAGKQKKRASHH